VEERQRTASVVGVRLSPAERVLYFDPGSRDLAFGDRVVVETLEGPKAGSVVIAPHQVLYSEIRGGLPPVLEVVEAAEKRNLATD